MKAPAKDVKTTVEAEPAPEVEQSLGRALELISGKGMTVRVKEGKLLITPRSLAIKYRADLAANKAQILTLVKVAPWSVGFKRMLIWSCQDRACGFLEGILVEAWEHTEFTRPEMIAEVTSLFGQINERMVMADLASILVAYMNLYRVMADDFRKRYKTTKAYYNEKTT